MNRQNTYLSPYDNIKLYDALKYSYQPLNKQEEFYKRQGYKLDRDLSNDNQQVLYNKDKNKLLYNIAGTHNLKDWGTDAYLLFGNIKNTNRYKEADERLKKAKQKYNINNATITGHSLGATLGNYIASGSNDKAYLLDEGATFGQIQRNNPNHKHYRTSGDLVSLLHAEMPNMTTLKNKNWLKDPLTAHNVDNIKNEKIFI